MWLRPAQYECIAGLPAHNCTGIALHTNIIAVYITGVLKKVFINWPVLFGNVAAIHSPIAFGAVPAQLALN
jgi:hypothetical protein